jgi:hypothetical protein
MLWSFSAFSIAFDVGKRGFGDWGLENWRILTRRPTAAYEQTSKATSIEAKADGVGER